MSVQLEVAHLKYIIWLLTYSLKSSDRPMQLNDYSSERRHSQKYKLIFKQWIL
jgi:hypothetical protein